MTKWIIAILAFASAISMISASYAQAPMNNSTSGHSVSNTTSGVENMTPNNKIVEILGLDQTAFPKVKANVFINKFCAMAGNLKKEDFKVKENGKEAVIDNFYFTGKASGQKLDLAIVFDDTRSMVGEISAMKSKVKDLTDTIKASGIDANYSLVSFKDSVSVKTKRTNDPAVFKKNVDALSADGGGDVPEDSLDAIEAVLSMGFRPDAQKVILIITDAHAHFKDDGSGFSNYTKDQMENDLKVAGIIFIPVSPTFTGPKKDADLKEIAKDIQSMWIDMKSADFLAILDQFKEMITGTYVIEYTSPDQTSGGNRTVTVTVNTPGCVVGNDSISYNRPGNVAMPNAPPVLNSLTSDKLSPQDTGTVVAWTANATDPDGDQIFYRFFLNDNPMNNWTTNNTLTWRITVADVGSNRIEIQVRDGKHAGSNGMDDRKSASFTINELKPSAPANQPPIINDLVATQDKGMAISWNAKATDPDGDQILYRFFLNNKSMMDWTIGNKWTLNATDANAGENKVKVQIRDGKHNGPEGYDDAKSVQFNLSSMKLMAQTWEKTFGGPNYDEGYSVQQTSDGGYIITGKVDYNFQGDLGLIKTDANGNKLWDKTFGGPKDDVGYSVEQTSDGGYIITGETQSYGSGSTDVWLIKTDSLGNKMWDRTFGGADEDEGRAVHQTSDGGFIIAGATNYNYKNNRGANAWLIKTDSQGNKVWDKTFKKYAGCWAESVQQTSDGGYIVTGVTQSQGSTMDLNVWLIKTDSQGKIEWERTFGGSNDDWGKSVQKTNDGGYIISGYTKSYSSGDGDADAWLIKVDSLGKKVWDRTFGGSGYDVANSAQQTSDGGYIIAGQTEQDGKNGVLLIKTDTSGNEEWENNMFSNAFPNLWGNSVQQTSDGGYIVAGTIGDSNQDIYLMKTDTNGNV